jgi:hypothetical protein
VAEKAWLGVIQEKVQSVWECRVQIYRAKAMQEKGNPLSPSRRIQRTRKEKGGMLKIEQGPRKEQGKS